MRVLVYVVGEPGAGKTSAVAWLLDGRERWQSEEVCPYVSHIRRPGAVDDGLPEVVFELGRRREGFSGTDALAMSVQPKAVRLMQGFKDPTLMLGEGDRLGNDKFLTACEADGWRVRVVHLVVPPSVGAARRAARGTTQNEAWVRGRVTKTQRLAERWGAARVDGRQTRSEVAADLHNIITRELTTH